MKRPLLFALLALCVNAALLDAAEQKKEEKEPPIINPGPPPSDSIVLFDGRELSKWKGQNGPEAKWKLVGDGAMEVNGTGSIMTKDQFGDCQLHVEWATPAVVKGEGQGRGN